MRANVNTTAAAAAADRMTLDCERFSELKCLNHIGGCLLQFIIISSDYNV